MQEGGGLADDKGKAAEAEKEKEGGAKDEGKVEGKAGKDSGDAAKADGTEGGDVKVKKEGGEELADDMGTGLDEALGKTKVRGRGRVRARADGGWEGSLTG